MGINPANKQKKKCNVLRTQGTSYNCGESRAQPPRRVVETCDELRGVPVDRNLMSNNNQSEHYSKSKNNQVEHFIEKGKEPGF